MRFTGSIDAKTDEKGRVFVPSVFRKILQKEEEEGLVLRRDLFVNCLVLYPKSVWDAQVDSIRARTNPFDRHQREGMRLFTADAENITLDSGGRMLIPRRYMEHATCRHQERCALHRCGRHHRDLEQASCRRPAQRPREGRQHLGGDDEGRQYII